MGQSLFAHLCLGREEAGEREGAILAGLMLVGDERVTPMIKEVCAKLPPPGTDCGSEMRGKAGVSRSSAPPS
jgi:hypothetical protein